MNAFEKECQLKTKIAKDNKVLLKQIERNTQMDMYYIIQENGERHLAKIQPGTEILTVLRKKSFLL